MAGFSIFLAYMSLCSSYLIAMEKLPAQYLIAYGNPSAPIKVVEYYSLSCPKCLESIKKDFPELKKNYIASKNVFWIFHPHPADRLTLQAMICFEQLSDEEKRIFWEVVVENIEKPTDGCFIMQTAMEAFGKPIPHLSETKFLKETPSFKTAFTFLKQQNIVTELPTVEINEKIYEEFPSRKFLEAKFSSLMEVKKQ